MKPMPYISVTRLISDSQTLAEIAAVRLISNGRVRLSSPPRGFPHICMMAHWVTTRHLLLLPFPPMPPMPPMSVSTPPMPGPYLSLVTTSHLHLSFAAFPFALAPTLAPTLAVSIARTNNSTVIRSRDAGGRPTGRRRVADEESKGMGGSRATITRSRSTGSRNAAGAGTGTGSVRTRVVVGTGGRACGWIGGRGSL